MGRDILAVMRALGGALAAALLEGGWIERAGGREVRVTATGAEAL
jgi:hypothetical protein